MSQIDQAFIKAYHQQSPSPATDASATAKMKSGAQVRADVPQPARSRVPTPHLQVALGKAAWLAERKAEAQAAKVHAPSPVAQQPTESQAPTPAPAKKKITFSSPSLWSPTSRLGQRYRQAETPPAPTTTPAQAPAQSPAPQRAFSPPPSHNRFISIEETLLRLDGAAATSHEVANGPTAEPDNTLKLVGQLREVEMESPVEAPAEPEKTPEVEVAAAPTVAPVVEEEPAPIVETPVEPVVETATAAAAEVVEPVIETIAPPVEEPVAEVAAEATAEPAPATFQAVWEVDAFQWPEVTDRLQQDAGEEIAAACQTLAAHLTPDSNLLAVTGIEDNAGATTLTLTLARGLAQQGLNVAIVDADFDRPMLAERLGVRVQDGWEAALGGKLPLEEVCITSLGDHVTLVPLTSGSEMSANKASLIAASVIQRLSSVFDIVLIDAGSGSENVAAVATSSDGVLDVAVLLAVDERHPNPADTNDMIGRLQQCALGSIQMAQTFVTA